MSRGVGPDLHIVGPRCESSSSILDRDSVSNPIVQGGTMLVIERKQNDQIRIGHAGDTLTEPIVVTLCEIRGGRVHLGFEAQKDINICRVEKYSESRCSRKPVSRKESD